MRHKEQPALHTVDDRKFTLYNSVRKEHRNRTFGKESKNTKFFVKSIKLCGCRRGLCTANLVSGINIFNVVVYFLREIRKKL